MNARMVLLICDACTYLAAANVMMGLTTKVILKPKNIVFCAVSLFVAGLNVKYVYPQVVCDIDS